MKKILIGSMALLSVFALAGCKNSNTKFKYNGKGYMQKETVESHGEVISIHENIYNEKDQLLFELTYNTLVDLNTIMLYSKEEYKYDSKGLLTNKKKYTYDKKGKSKLSGKIDYEYKNGKIIKETEYSKGIYKDDLEIFTKKEYDYYEDGNTKTYKYYSYWSKNVYTCTTEEYIYDENNKLKTKNVYTPENVFSGEDKLVNTYEYTYNEKGENISVVFKNLNVESQNYTQTFEYDENGYEIKSFTYSIIDEETDTIAITEKDTKTYDSIHNLVSEIIEELDEDNTTYYVSGEQNCVYDADNRITFRRDYTKSKYSGKELVLEYKRSFQYIPYD